MPKQPSGSSAKPSAQNNADKQHACPPAFAALQEDKTLPQFSELRQNNYLNNVLEQDHHFLQQLTKQGVEFKFFTLGLENPIKGYEAMNMLRRGQVIGVLKGDGQAQLNFMAQILEVAA